MTLKDKIYTQGGWVYLTSENPNTMMSGWKIHIFGTTPEDSLFVGENLQTILDKYSMVMKVASSTLYEVAIADLTHKQYGKCATMYIPPIIFKQGKLQEFIEDVQSALKGYDKTGAIHGDKSLDGTIHYRYELSKPINIEEGINHSVYSIFYQANRGAHNIDNNPDPFETISHEQATVL